MDKTRDELIREMQQKLQETPDASFMHEIAIPGVATPVKSKVDDDIA